MSVPVYIGVGSNIDPDLNIPKALKRLCREATVTGVSIFYRCAALGRPTQAPFTNGVFRVLWNDGPEALKTECLRGIETRLGRQRGSDRYADRTIDLDILLFGDRRIGTDGVVVPDPDIMRRPFIYIPLLELAPDIVVPGVGCLQDRLAGPRLPSSAGLQPVVGLSDVLRSILRKNMKGGCFNEPG